MRTPTGATSGSRAARTGKTGRVLLAGVLAASLSGSIALSSAPALADPRPPVIPSQAQVDAARRAVGGKAAQVGAIEARLAAANSRLELLGREAGRAAEAYNGAVYKLAQARVEAAAAAARAAKAQATVDQQRRQIGRFAAASYQGGGDVARVGQLFSADGPQAVLDAAGASQSVSSAMQGSLLRFTATQVVSNAFRLQANQAVAAVKTATDAAAVAKNKAAAAQRAQVAAVGSIATERRQLIGQLATLRSVSYRVAEQRQNGLEELARQKAAAEAERKAAEQRRKAAALAAAQAAQRAADAARAAQAQAQAQAEKQRAQRARKAAQRAAAAAKDARRANDRAAREAAARRAANAAAAAERKAREAADRARQRDRERDRDRDNGGSGGGTSGPSRGSSSGAQRAIDFARAQLGEPYVWGAAGPGSWDCSGLTMKAWARSGVSLPHYSVAQYEQTRKISEAELRPGDLIFWANNAGDPGTIFHVGLYIGSGKMIHAPRAGKPVKVESVYYWEDPDFFTRP